MSEILATNKELSKIIDNAVKRIGENHSLSRDSKGVEMNAMEIEKDRLKFRKDRISESAVVKERGTTIDNALKEAADEIAEKMVLENTIGGMVKDVITEQDNTTGNGAAKTLPVTLGGDNMQGLEEQELMESTRNTIKKLIKKKLKEGWTKDSMPGYEEYMKVDTDNGKINKEYEKEFKKKFDDYSDFEGNDKPEFPHSENSKSSEGYEKYENTTDDEEFVDDFAYPGLQDFDVHNQDMDRLSKYLEGSSETGNAQTDEKGEALGNVVPSDLGKKILKSKKRRKEKIDAQNASKTNIKSYTPDVQKVKQVKEDVKSDITDMKKLWDYNKKTQ
tara:strand:+ start:141 stop:1136 length:996 start_codon:yes stop_codon:yes gene_type:complete